MNFVQSLNMFGIPAKEIPCLTGKGAPTTSTAAAVGCLYMDEETGELYKCTEKFDSAFTWEVVEAGGSSYPLPCVMDYGAKGDSKTDDTKAFQDALAENRVVYVPSGTYVLSDTLVIRENCCLELSQDTVLKFTQTSGNCIEMRGSAVLRGNHAVISAAFGLTGNVISMDTSLDGVPHNSIPPYEKACPQWKRQRFVYDVNIIKPNSEGFNRPLDDGIAHIQVVEVVSRIPQHERLEVSQAWFLVRKELIVEPFRSKPLMGIDGKRFLLCTS